MAAFFALLVFGSLSTSSAGAAEPLTTASVDSPTILVNRQPSQRRLRGDWEPPDSVVVVYSSLWSSQVGAIVSWSARAADVLLLLPVDDQPDDLEAWLAEHEVDAGRVAVTEVDIDSVWIRDFGPLQVSDNGAPLWLDASYTARPADDQVAAHLAVLFRVTGEGVPEELDGGGIISNGDGLCSSTEEFFVKLGGDASDQVYVDKLLGQIGCRLLVLVPALSRDETRHVDMFAQFVSRDRVIVAGLDEVAEPEDADRMNRAVQRLVAGARQLGVRLEVTRIPTPTEADGIYYTYVNGFQVGDRFIVPSYDAVPAGEEKAALAALHQGFAGRKIPVPVAADDMIALQGAIHCITLGLHHRRRGAARGFMPRVAATVGGGGLTNGTN